MNGLGGHAEEQAQVRLGGRLNVDTILHIEGTWIIYARGEEGALDIYPRWRQLPHQVAGTPGVHAIAVYPLTNESFDRTSG